MTEQQSQQVSAPQGDLCACAWGQGERTTTHTFGLTLEQYAEAKRLPVEFLEELGLRTVRVRGQSRVEIAYTNPYGSLVCSRYRHSLKRQETGPDNRFSWKSGSKGKIVPYGLWALSEAKRLDYVLLVEGESDTQTLLSYEIPALGIPGADMFRSEWAEYLKGLKVYVWREPDEGGTEFIRILSERLGDGFSVLTPPPGLKDISQAHIEGRDVPALVQELIASSVSVADVKAKELEQNVAQAWYKCSALAQSPNILHELELLLPKLGYAGDPTNPKIIYLVITSRLLDRLLSVILRGPSSAGKSYQAETVLPLFPPTAYLDFTGMSEHALAFGQEDLSHRILVIFELAALSSDYGSYLLRSLLSEGKITYEITVKGAEGSYTTQRIERPGPTGAILTSTAPQIDAECETRLLSLTVSDAPDQTRLILQKQAESRNGHGPDYRPDVSAWVSLQEWLQLAGRRSCSIPYAGALANLCDSRAVRMRRDFPQLLSLIMAHTLLHQATRQVNEWGQVIATIEDYRAVYELVSASYGEQLSMTVRRETRETVQAVAQLIESDKGKQGKDGEPLSVGTGQVTALLGLDRSTVARRLQVAEAAAYLRNLESRYRQAARWALGDPLPGEEGAIPAPEILQSVYAGTLSQSTRTSAQVTVPAPETPENVCCDTLSQNTRTSAQVRTVDL